VSTTAGARTQESNAPEASAAPTLANYWHPIARSEDLTEQPKQFTLLSEQIVAFRTDDGVSAFKDLCIHRGTRLSLGWVTDGHLTCPYHGWEYDRTGACVRIPSLPEGSNIPRKARAIAYQAQERYGLVWVSMADPIAPIPGFPEHEWDDPSFRGFLSATHEWKSSAGRAVENFLDATHFPFVHEGLLGSRDRTVMEDHDVIETSYGLTYYYDQEDPSGAHGTHGVLTRFEYHLYTPFTVHLKKTIPDGEITIMTLISAPTAPKLTHMYFFITRNHGLDEPDKTWTDFTNTVLAQDKVIVESQLPEEIPTDLKEELHLRVPDASGIAYRRLLGRIDQVAAFMP
jgi:phenylpropionate dioxygenase-like ring-hydroxylating dioxygenase large terminal subunit